jgi:uncharacterized protein (TIGR03083 family)
MTAEHRIAVLRASHERLVSIVEGLTPEQLRQPGYPSEWTIAQVLSHLGSGAEIGLLAVDAGLANAEPPSRESFPAIWERWNNASPDEQAADFVTANAAYLARVEANADSTATFMSFMGPTDLDGIIAGRLSEHAVHTWDVEVMFNPAATVQVGAIPTVFDLAARLAGFFAKPGGWSGVVHVTTTDPDREFALTLGEKSSLADGPGDAADAKLSVSGDAFVRLLYGRLDPDHTPGGIEADGITLDDLRSIFKGF